MLKPVCLIVGEKLSWVESGTDLNWAVGGRQDVGGLCGSGLLEEGVWRPCIPSTTHFLVGGCDMKTRRRLLARLGSGVFVLAVVSSTLMPVATASSQAPVGLGTA